MKKPIAIALSGSLIVLGVAAGSTFPADSASAADLANISVNCTSASDIVGVTITATGGVGDRFKIQNVGTSQCQVVDNDGVLTDEANVPGNTTSGFFTVAKSGIFEISSAAGGASVDFVVDACSLPGAGVESDPWLVDSQADFQLIGDSTGANSCTFGGHYLQTADLTGDEQLDNYTADIVGDGTEEFTGVYDGDHYQISLGGTDGGAESWKKGTNEGGSYESRGGLFPLVDGGTIKKVRLTGEIRSSATWVGPLAGRVYGGGLISEVSSQVNIEVSSNAARVGGIVAVLGSDDSDADEGGRIQYSRYVSSSGIQSFAPAGDVVFLGGIVGALEADDTTVNSVLEVRDSYVQARFQFNSDNRSNDAGDYNVGGVVGLYSGSAEGTRLVRNYTVVTVDDTCTTCNAPSGALRIGGLAAILDPQLVAATFAQGGVDALIANFFVTSAAVTTATADTTKPADYAASDPYLPIAVPVSASELRTLSTFITEENQDSTGNPGGDEIVAAASDGSGATSADYRWAITGERSTFVPSTYTTTAADDPGSASDQNDYFNRRLYDPSSDGAKEYLTKRVGVLDAHGGIDPRSTTTYTTLGNVWEICPGEDYPTLVWEEETCGGGGSSSRDDDDDDDSVTTAASLGLTDAEYAAYLASGLTLEQFRAQRLAATGPADLAFVWGGGMIAALFALGSLLVWVSRRERAAGRL